MWLEEANFSSMHIRLMAVLLENKETKAAQKLFSDYQILTLFNGSLG